MLEPTTAARLLKRAKAKAERERHEDDLAFQILTHRLPIPLRQHRFAVDLGRQWRFDFAWADQRIAAEVEGLVAMPATVAGRRTVILTGRHASPEGYKGDVDKYNAATLLGWRLLRFHQDLIRNGEAIAMLERVFHASGWRR